MIISIRLPRASAMLGAERALVRTQRRHDVGANLRGLETWLSGIAQDLARCGEETPQRVADAIDRLNDRLDQLIDSGRSAASEFERRVAAVDHALDELNGETQRAARATTGRTTVDDAVDEISARQQALDEREDDGGTRAFRQRRPSRPKHPRAAVRPQFRARSAAARDRAAGSTSCAGRARSRIRSQRCAAISATSATR